MPPTCRCPMLVQYMYVHVGVTELMIHVRVSFNTLLGYIFDICLRDGKFGYCRVGVAVVMCIGTCVSIQEVQI